MSHRTQPLMVIHTARLFAIPAIAMLIGVCAIAQTPNPLMRPASRDTALGQPVSSPDQGGQRARVPQARPVPDGAGGGAMPTMPGSTSSNGLSPYASPENLARDELALYSVTAIMDNIAILRLASTDSRSGAESSNTRTQAVHPSVIRVRTGSAISIAGTTLVPTVAVAHVDFSLQSGGHTTVATVGLESNSGRSSPDARETPDATFATRIAPTKSQNTSGASATVPGASGAAQAGAGTIPTSSVR